MYVNDRAEAMKRYGENADDEVEISDVGEMRAELNYLTTLKQKFRNLLHLDENQEVKVRKKRSIDEDETLPNSRLTEELFSEALSGHKIRDIEEKVALVDEREQIIQEIMHQFCQPKVDLVMQNLQSQLTNECSRKLENQSQTLNTGYQNALKEFLEKLKGNENQKVKVS